MRLAKQFGVAAGFLLALTAPAVAQEVAGVVVDARTGRPFEGARVAVLGQAITVRTNAQGRFRLAGLTGDSVRLNVTMIGHRPVNRTVAVGRTDVRVELQVQAVNLAEVIVTGTAGSVEKRTLGNLVSTVQAADVQAIAPAPDVSNLINGRAPGVVVVPGTGQVGAGPRIRIRGTNSFSLSDQPLLYVDGVRINNEVATGIVVQAFGSGVVSRLNDFDPDNIESIEIIKGPAASTLYGTEAANGVIQIITKKGRTGDAPRVAVSIRQGTQWFMDPEGRIRQPVNHVCPPGTPANQRTSCPLKAWNPVRQEDSLFKAGLVDRPLFTNGYMMGYGINVSGGTNAVRYFSGATFDRDEGIEPTNDQRRFTMNLNLSLTPNDKWDLQTTLAVVKSKLNQAFEAGAGGIWFSTIFGDPALTEPRTDGSPHPNRGFLFGPPEYQWGFRQPSQTINRFTVSMTWNNRPTAWLSHRLTAGLDQTDEGSEQLNRFLKPEWVQFNPGVAALGFKFHQRRAVAYTTLDYNANATFRLTDIVGSTSTVGAQFYRKRRELVSATGEQFPAPGLETIAATAINRGFDDFVENTTVGVFAQQQISWKDRLFLTGAIRVDNNSAFGKDFDFVTYPKLGASYVVTERATGRINALRLRAAYGQSGQQPDDFAALRSYQAVTGGDGGPAVIPQFVGNPSLRPERSTEIELGFDAGLLNDRLGADFTFYHAKTRDAILQKSLAPSTGFPGLQFINAGAIRNVGLEAKLSATPVQRPNLAVESSLSFSHNSNEVLDLGGVDSLGTFGPKVGFPVDAIFRKKVISAQYDPVTKRAINVLCAGGPDGKTGLPCTSPAAGGVYLGVWDPRWEGSFSSTVTVRGRLRLYGLVDFKLGNRHFDNNLRALCQVLLRCDMNFNPQNYDILTIAEMQSNNVAQSWVINDASFTKLRELSASYSFPRHHARWLRGREATLTLSARNLHTWTKWTGLDPEAYFVSNLFTRLEQDNTPQLASFQATLNITF
ncbi:MAG: SusC/RagA family TonB-linked outer membrane protein [Gemmatimonadaceae bacterium]